MHFRFSPTQIVRAFCDCFQIPEKDFYPLRQMIVNMVNNCELGFRDDRGKFPKFSKDTASDLALFLFSKTQLEVTKLHIAQHYHSEGGSTSIYDLTGIEHRVSQEYPWLGWMLEIAETLHKVESESQPPRLVRGFNIGIRHRNQPPRNDHIIISATSLGLWWLPDFWHHLESEKQ